MDAVCTKSRIDQCFEKLSQQGRSALITFITAGDPDYQTSLTLLKRLPASGADIIELGMPFSDPMADGPTIQASSQRALKAGHKMKHTLAMVREFRETNQHTPIILMGYYNPIYVYPVGDFLEDARAAGVDGLIVVDIPPEADEELCLPATQQGINFIRLATPTTDAKRLPVVLKNSSGFVYYVSIAGITGTSAPETNKVHQQVKRIKRETDLPVAVGFGVTTAEQVREIARGADGVVVGSAIVSTLEKSLDAEGKAGEQSVENTVGLVEKLAEGVLAANS